MEQKNVTPVYFVSPDKLDEFLKSLSEIQRNWLKSFGFSASYPEICPVSERDGKLSFYAAGWGNSPLKDRFPSACIANKLPKGHYRADTTYADEINTNLFELGLKLSSYSFDRYKIQDSKSEWVTNENKIIDNFVSGEFLCRDLINTPASDMGPAEVEAAASTLSTEFNASMVVLRGDELIKQNFPLIHAVGRASDRLPRLIEIDWGEEGAPLVTLVGKGVGFDTGGLNIKPGSSMALMKKDMGGAATVLAIARMVMGMGLNLRLRVLIPAVENSISGNAMRPGDILTARNGKTIEINNTDAEGRLILADALAYADEKPAELLISMATLTGAARVALGPDLPPYYTPSDTLAKAIENAASAVIDPVWRMPLWHEYEGLIEPDIADLDNAPSGGMAGSITAALFLNRFVNATSQFAHFDIYGWSPKSKPWQSAGGACQAGRLVAELLRGHYGV